MASPYTGQRRPSKRKLPKKKGFNDRPRVPSTNLYNSPQKPSPNDFTLKVPEKKSYPARPKVLSTNSYSSPQKPSPGDITPAPRASTAKKPAGGMSYTPSIPKAPSTPKSTFPDRPRVPSSNRKPASGMSYNGPNLSKGDNKPAGLKEGSTGSPKHTKQAVTNPAIKETMTAYQRMERDRLNKEGWGGKMFSPREAKQMALNPTYRKKK